MTSIHYLLQLARLQYQKGDFRESRKLAEQGKASHLQDTLQWIDCVRLIYQCSFELDELENIQNLFEDLLTLNNNNPAEKISARVKLILGMWSLSKGQIKEAELFVQSSVDLSTKAGDHETLARALYASAACNMHGQNFATASKILDKLEILTTELKFIEVEIGCLIARSQIYSLQHNYDKALSLLWSAMEQARLHGFPYSSAQILALLASLFKDQNDFERLKIYGELALTGITEYQYPRWHRILKTLLPADLIHKASNCDIILDNRMNLIKERQKGLVDFRNQHILFELAQTFILNPGARYGKEQLIKNIWKQDYNPQVHDNLIYVSIKRLRLLIEPDPEAPRYILRDRKGYYLPKHINVQIQNPEEAQ